MSRLIQHLGWIKDRFDPRDFIYYPKVETVLARPKEFNLTNLMPPVYDQGNLGSCTANAINGVVEYLNMKQYGAMGKWTPSRLFVYYNERVMLNTVNEDSGAMIRDGIKSINAQGVCYEEPTWPYDVNKFSVKPPENAYKEAMDHQSLKYARVSQSVQDIESRLFEGFPIVFGIEIYSSFMSDAVAKSGEVPMPRRFWMWKMERLLGGHAIVLVGYNNMKKKFIARNSWGEKWGANGYFTIPYDYVLDSGLADDFWTIQLME